MTTSLSDNLSNKEFILKNVNSSIIELISGQQAIGQLQKADDFINNFSSFDVESRLHSSSATTQDYFDLLAQHVLPWDEVSSQSIASRIDYLNTECINQLKLLTLPSRILVILTDGKDENNAAYCRNENVIVIPQTMISSGQIHRTFIHELFHIWSRWNTNLIMRDELYATIGYFKIPIDKPLEFPADLSSIKITNPDAPLTMKYYINLKKSSDEGEKIYKCTPILHASQPFDANFSNNMFDYIVATTLILDDNTYEPLQPLQYLSYQEANNFFEQIGHNTMYIIHPEEILADNFVLWMTDNKDSAKLKTPTIVNKMNDIISGAVANHADDTLAQPISLTN